MLFAQRRLDASFGCNVVLRLPFRRRIKAAPCDLLPWTSTLLSSSCSRVPASPGCLSRLHRNVTLASLTISLTPRTLPLSTTPIPQASLSRSVVFVLAYIMKEKGCSAAEAVAIMKPKWDATWPNDTFVQQLLEYEDDIANM